MSLEEKLAELCHDQWSHWMKYKFSRCHYQTEPPWTVSIPFTSVERWRRQTDTPYSELDEREKESDREWAKKFAEAFAEWQDELDRV